MPFMTARFPRLDPYRVPDEQWHDVPLSEQHAATLAEPYLSMLRRRRPQYTWDRMVKPCPGHLWMRIEHGPWVCEHCPQERWRL